MKRRMNTTLTARLILLLISLAALGWVILSISNAFRVKPDQINPLPYSEYIAKTVDFARADVDKFFGIAVLIFAGLWTLILVDKNHSLTLRKDNKWTLQDAPEWAMACIAWGLLISFFYFDQKYEQLLTKVYLDTAKLPGHVFPDLLNSPYVALHRDVLLRCFYSGMFVSALTVISAVIRKHNSPE